MDINVFKSLECYLNIPDRSHPEQSPISYYYLWENLQADKQLLAPQQKDKQLLVPQQKHPKQWIKINIDDDNDDIICYIKLGNDLATQCKIALQNSQVGSHCDETSRR